MTDWTDRRKEEGVPMSEHRRPATRVATVRTAAGMVAALLAGCSDSPSEPVFGDDVVVRNATLEVMGGSGADDIRITVTGAAVEVRMGGASAVFDEPVQRIRVAAGGGDDVVRVQQSVVRDIDLDLGGGEGDDDLKATFTPTGSGAAISVTARMDGGAGADVLGFSWDSKGEDLEASVALTVDGTIALPEVDDEVVVSFEGGDPDQPIIVGGVYNPSAPADPGPGGDAHRLTFTAALTGDGPDVEVGVLGGIGRDDFTLEADYSGVLGQQGRVVVDADVDEGDNQVGVYLVTGVSHVYAESNVVGGGGSNTIVMDDRIGGDVDRVYTVELGDGDANSTSIRFGDGLRGARPSTGQRNVTARYRSGSGTNTVSLDADLVEPLTSDVTLDFGEGTGSVVGAYALPSEPASDGSGPQAAPSQIKVLILSPNQTDLDFIARMADPQPDDGVDEPGKITIAGTGVRGGRLDFLRLLGVETSPDGGSAITVDDWTVGLSDLALAGPLSVSATADGAVRSLTYLQERVQLDAGASLEASLLGHDGADRMLAHLLGLSGDGRFAFALDGGAGADFGAALTRDMDPAGTGALTFDVRTGDGDDQAAVETLVDLQRSGPVTHRIDAGAGTDACYASAVVLSAGCESREGITQQFLQLLTELFGAELASAWGAPG